MNKKKTILKTLGAFINITAPLFPKWNREYSFKLLCKVNRVGISEKGKAFFERGTQHFFTIEDEKVALHKWGTGSKTLFFVHGWMSNSQRWQPYVDSLDLSQYTAYALDAQGHGMSNGTSLNIEIYRKAVAKSLKFIGPIDTVVGHSLGSLVIGYTYLVNPNLNVNRYVIMGSPAGMHAIFEYFKVMLNLNSKAIDNLLIKVNEVLKISVDSISMHQFFAKIDKPTLVVHEKTDMVTPFEPILNGVKQNKDLSTYYTEGFGHNLEDHAVVDRVIDYITTPINQTQPH